MDSFLNYQEQRTIPQAIWFYVMTLGGLLVVSLLVLFPLILFGVLEQSEGTLYVQLGAVLIGAYITYRIRKDKGYDSKDVALKVFATIVAIGFLSPVIGYMIVAAFTLDENKNQPKDEGPSPIPTAEHETATSAIPVPEEDAR